MTTVFATPATHYHKDPDCRSLHAAQSIADWDCGDEPCRHRHYVAHTARPMSIDTAAASGKWPCHYCVPAAQRIFPQLNGQTFGHEPFQYDGVKICARCYTTEVRCSLDAFGIPRRSTVRLPVPWPCTSAIVFGPVPRPEHETVA